MVFRVSFSHVAPVITLFSSILVGAGSSIMLTTALINALSQSTANVAVKSIDRDNIIFFIL